MAAEQATLWVTYVSEGQEAGDFSFLVGELTGLGVNAFFDRIEVRPGSDLWEQMAAPMSEPSLDGWAFVLTPSNLASAVCREELAYVLDRVNSARGQTFPVLLLLHGVRTDRIPPALRAPGLVSLADPEWKEKLARALHLEPATRRATRGPRQPRPAAPPSDGPPLGGAGYTMRIHRGVEGKPQQTALEFLPASGELEHWIFGIPVSCHTLTGWGRWESGGLPARTALLDPDRNDVVVGIRRRIQDTTYVFRGAGDPLSSEKSAYVLFYGAVPRTIVFAHGEHPDGDPVIDEQVFKVDLDSA